MKLIELTQNQIAKVSDNWYDYLNRWNWQARWNESTKSYYACRTEYEPRKTTIAMARVVANTPDGMICDHINHDTLDNQEDNLRNVTNQQNLMNLKCATTRNSLGILGVQKHNKKFRSYIMINGKQISGKVKETIEEAIQDRKNLELVYFGEFSYSSSGA